MHLMDQTQILLWILALVILEIFHFKWIWWTEWSCRKCGRKNQDCPCEGTKWMMYL